MGVGQGRCERSEVFVKIKKNRGSGWGRVGVGGGLGVRWNYTNN